MSIRANAVEVDKIFRACCRIDGCHWIGLDRHSYQEANAERLQHLEHHRRGGGNLVRPS